MKSLMLGALASAAIMVAAPATAATFVFLPGQDALAPGEQVFASFNDAADDGIVTGSNFQFYTDTSFLGARPSAGDQSRYLSVLNGGTASIDFGGSVQSVSLDIGSVDSFNQVTLLFANGSTQTFTGADLVANPDGNQVEDRTNGRFRFLASVGEEIAGIRLTSGGNSLEVDRIALAGAVAVVPEPGTWAMMIAGFGMVGGLARRRRRTLSLTA